MVTLTPFEAVVFGGTRKVYSVNSRKPEKEISSMTTSYVCPKCKERNIFRVYKPIREVEESMRVTTIYACKCPDCGKEFEIEDVFDKEEE